MTSLKIICSAIGLAIAYGIVHDLITAHLCVEYFTIGHPKVIESESPLSLALLWGVIASWWMGLLMGLLLAGYTQLGRRPKLPFREISGKLLRLLGIMGLVASAAGLIGYALAAGGWIHLLSPLAEKIASTAHDRYLAVAWAHEASYLGAVVGTALLCVSLWRRRKADSSGANE
jgi:hypothetical protein